MLWLPAIQLSHIFTSVSISCTAIGLLSEFEAENVYIVTATSIQQNTNFSDQPGIGFNNVKSHFSLRCQPFNLFQVLFTAVQVCRFLFMFFILWMSVRLAATVSI